MFFYIQVKSHWYSKNLRLQEGYLTLVEHYEIPRGKNMFYFFIMQLK